MGNEWIKGDKIRKLVKYSGQLGLFPAARGGLKKTARENARETVRSSKINSPLCFVLHSAKAFFII